MEITNKVIEWLLVPKALPGNSRYKNPKTWMGSQMWEVVRQEVYKRAKYVCEVCGGKGDQHPVEAHELWIFNMKTKEQILIRFVALCPYCHALQHMGLAGIHNNSKQLDGKDFVKHFNKLTNSNFTFNEIYEVGMTVYEKISRMSYTVVLDRHEEPLLKLWQDN